MEPNTGWFGRLQKNFATGLLQRLDRLPRHIGIIMDGNRRFAQTHGTDRKTGHTSGFDRMNQILALAYSVGIPEISVYAFSIENFNRTPEEVNDLMQIARTKLRELVAHAGLAEEYGVRVRIIGDLRLLPQDIQDLSQEIMTQTEHNDRATLNLCMPYTSRDDMTHAIASAAHGANALKKNSRSPFSESRVGERLRMAGGPPLDLLVRTSDTIRLSDFMLWEITDDTYIDFVKALWPEYTPFQFLATVLRWWARKRR